jgi:hypothetical protein
MKATLWRINTSVWLVFIGTTIGLLVRTLHLGVK